MEEQQVLHILCVCVCRLSYTTPHAHSPYCRLWPVWLYNIFPHYHINGTIFGKKVGKMLKLLYFIYNFCPRHFSFEEEFKRYMIINLHRFFTQPTRYFCQILSTLESYGQVFENYSDIKFHENPCSGNRAVPCGWMDGRTDRQE